MPHGSSGPTHAATPTETAPVPPPEDDQIVTSGPPVPVWATVIALLAGIGAVIDLIVTDFGTTALHTLTALTVFGAVRVCLGAALTPRPSYSVPPPANG